MIKLLKSYSFLSALLCVFLFFIALFVGVNTAQSFEGFPQCKTHPDLPDYTQLSTVDAKPARGVNAGLFQLPLAKPFTFSMTVKNNGSDSKAFTYIAGFNQCVPSDLTVNPWKCTGAQVSGFTQTQTQTVGSGETKTFSFSTDQIVCGKRYQYDIYIPYALTQTSACGPDMSGLVEFICEQPTPTPTSTPTPTPTPTTVPSSFSCTGLSASPTSGLEGVKVTFSGNGNANGGKVITGFEFTFGDNSGAFIDKRFEGNGSVSIDHTYPTQGKYVASVRVKEQGGAFSDIPDSCKRTIDVFKTPTQIPSTGVEVIPLAMMGGSLGWFLIKKALI